MPHRRLLHKLSLFGIQGHLHAWFTDYLHSISQRVVVEGVFSSWLPVISGVPQPSILGPFLFLLYINDLPNVLSITTSVALFADDVKCSKIVHNPDDCIETGFHSGKKSLDRIGSEQNLNCTCTFGANSLPSLNQFVPVNHLPQSDTKVALKAHERVKFCCYPVQSEDYFPESNLAFTLQHDLNMLTNWSNEWELSFNSKKCEIMRISRKRWIQGVQIFSQIRLFATKLHKSLRLCCS